MKRTALELFTGLADGYERALNVATLLQDRSWKAWVAKNIPAEGPGLVLDVGCGTLVLEEGMPRSTFVGLDLTEPMIRVGQSKMLSNTALLVHGDAESLPFRDSTFHSVVSCYVAKYVDEQRFVEELSRVAKPQAKVVLYDFVRPRGWFLPFLALYVYGAMRIAGWLLGLANREEAFTFRNLPAIVRGSTWDERIVEEFAREDLTGGSVRRLSGGIVAAYVGTKGAEKPLDISRHVS